MTTCASCGYAATDHEPGTGKCPLCACGATPAQHRPVPVQTKDGPATLRGCLCDCEVPPALHAPQGVVCELCAWRMPHACRWATWLGTLCPGRRGETSGEWLLLRQGTFKPAGPPETALWREVLARDTAARHAAADAAKVPWEPEHVPAPRIPSRPPRGLQEVAAGQGRQARGLGRKAVAAGWRALAAYWMAGDGTEGSAVSLARDAGRAVAIWTRAPGEKGWKTSSAYAWTIGAGRVPAKVTIAELERILNE